MFSQYNVRIAKVTRSQSTSEKSEDSVTEKVQRFIDHCESIKSTSSEENVSLHSESQKSKLKIEQIKEVDQDTLYMRMDGVHEETNEEQKQQETEEILWHRTTELEQANTEMTARMAQYDTKLLVSQNALLG